MSNSSLVYLLDTNVCIMYLKGRSPSIELHFNTVIADEIAVCSVVKAELFYGSMGSNNPQKNLNVQKSFLSQFVSLPFDDACAEVYGKIRRDLASLGTPIGIDFCNKFPNFLDKIYPVLKCYSSMPGKMFHSW